MDRAHLVKDIFIEFYPQFKKKFHLHKHLDCYKGGNDPEKYNNIERVFL